MYNPTASGVGPSGSGFCIVITRIQPKHYSRLKRGEMLTLPMLTTTASLIVPTLIPIATYTTQRTLGPLPRVDLHGTDGHLGSARIDTLRGFRALQERDQT